MPQLIEIILHELRIALRTRRVLVLLVLCVLGTLLFALVLQNASDAVLEYGAQQAQTTPDETRDIIAMAADENRAEIAAAIAGLEEDELASRFTQSIAGTFLLQVILFFLPWLILLTAFDRISSDLQSRSLIYYMARVPLWSIVVGRVLASALLALLIGGACAFLALLLVARAFPAEGFFDGIGVLTIGMVSLIPFALAWTGLIMLASSLTARPFAALALAVVFMSIWVLLGAFSLAEGGDFDFLSHLTHLAPSTWRPGHFHGDAFPFLGSAVVWLAFAAAFTSLAVLRTTRRQL